MSVPTPGEEFSKFIEHCRKAQESAAMLAHLVRDDDEFRSKGWMAISEMFKLTVLNATKLATGRLQ